MSEVTPMDALLVINELSRHRSDDGADTLDGANTFVFDGSQQDGDRATDLGNQDLSDMLNVDATDAAAQDFDAVEDGRDSSGDIEPLDFTFKLEDSVDFL